MTNEIYLDCNGTGTPLTRKERVLDVFKCIIIPMTIIAIVGLLILKLGGKL